MRKLILFFEAVFEILGILFEALGKELIDFFFPRKPIPKRPLQAHFAAPKTLLSPRHHGFRVTGNASLSSHDSYQNAMIIGGTGVGKSSVVLVPSILSMEGSIVVHDPSGELYTKTNRALKTRGYVVKTLNFSDVSTSGKYNPLIRANSGAEINKVAAMIIRTSFQGQGDPFWDLQAVNLLSILIHLVKTWPYPYQNLSTVRRLAAELSHNSQVIKEKILTTHDQRLIHEFQAFQGFDDKVRLGVVATLLSALQIFSDDSVATITNHDSFDFEELRIQKTAIFIQNPTIDQNYYSVLSAIFLEQLFGTLLKRKPTYYEYDIFCLIDEASSLHVPSLSVVIANVRKYQVGILLALQDYAQLVERYGRYDAETIKSNCFAKLYFTGQSLATTKELETILGVYEYPGEKGKAVNRPLLTNDEIRTLPKDKGILLCGHYRPILVSLKPYYQQAKLRKLTGL